MTEIAASFRVNFEVEGLAPSARYNMQQVLMEWLREAARNSNTSKLHKKLEAAAGISVPEFHLFVIDDLNTARDDALYEQARAAMKG